MKPFLMQSPWTTGDNAMTNDKAVDKTRHQQIVAAEMARCKWTHRPMPGDEPCACETRCRREGDVQYIAMRAALSALDTNAVHLVEAAAAAAERKACAARLDALAKDLRERAYDNGRDDGYSEIRPHPDLSRMADEVEAEAAAIRARGGNDG